MHHEKRNQSNPTNVHDFLNTTPPPPHDYLASLTGARADLVGLLGVFYNAGLGIAHSHLGQIPVIRQN